MIKNSDSLMGFIGMMEVDMKNETKFMIIERKNSIE